MPCPLPADCLNEIFENLDDQKIALHSCLLVSRLWCKISVRILWRDIWRFKYKPDPRSVIMIPISRLGRVASEILSILISCLPNESKELLHENVIFISTPTSKQPLFNYAAFFKVLSINEICRFTGRSDMVYMKFMLWKSDGHVRFPLDLCEVSMKFLI